MTEPKKGDVVRLKSGGPIMTFECHPIEVGSGFMIARHTRTDQAWCSWFDGTTLKEHIFSISALEKVEKAP